MISYFFDWLSGRKTYTPKTKPSQKTGGFNNDSRQLRGRRLLTRGEAAEEAKKHIPSDDRGIYWGGITLPTEAVTQNFVFVGQIKSGKTVSIKHLMAQVLPNIGISENDKRAIVYDAKGDFVSFLSGLLETRKHPSPDKAVKILNPFDERCVAWNMAKDITEPAHIQTVCTIIIPIDEGQNRFFTDAARQVLEGVMVSFLLTSKREKNNELNWTLRDVCLAVRDKRILKRILQKHDETAHLTDYLDRSNNDILTTLKSFIAPFEIIAAAWHGKEQVSLKDWRDDKKSSILVLGRDPEARTAIQALNRIIFERLSQIILKGDEATGTDRQSWIFLDEFSKMGKLTGFDDLITNGRSKGSCIALAFQNSQGVKAVYGEELAEEIISECGSKAFLKSDGATARWASNEIGKGKKEKTSRSITSGNTIKDGSVQIGETVDSTEEDILFPSDFAGLPIANKTNGVSGYYVTSWVSGVWHHQQKWNERDFGRIAEIKSKEKNFLDRGKTKKEPFYQFLNAELWEQTLENLGAKTEDVKQRETAMTDDAISDLERKIRERRQK